MNKGKKVNKKMSLEEEREKNLKSVLMPLFRQIEHFMRS
jgi:hypothetical protein